MTHATATKPHAQPSAPKTMGATEILCVDHKLVSNLFAKYEKARLTSKKKEIATRIFLELSGHAQAEGVVIYPTAQQVQLAETSGVPS